MPFNGYKREHANVSSYNARFYEGRAIQGHIAGKMTKSNKIGYIASFPIPEVIMGINSYYLHAKKVNPAVELTVVWAYTWFDPAKEASAHHLLEALWVHQQHNVENRELLDLVLNSPEPNARIAARRVARMWEHGAARPVAVGPASATRRPADSVATNDGAIVVRTVTEAMRYDREMFTVTAGQPVKVRFVNDDYAPHNLVIGTPGSRDEIGAAADRLGADGFARRFIPKTDKILAATELLEHQKSQVLEFRAPTVPGDYVILCTFPGHRQTMHGVMRVLK